MIRWEEEKYYQDAQGRKAKSAIAAIYASLLTFEKSILQTLEVFTQSRKEQLPPYCIVCLKSNIYGECT